MRSAVPAAAIACVVAVAGSATTSLTPIRGGPFEASGVTSVRGADGVLFVDDGRPGEVLWLPLGANGEGGDVQPVAIGATVADPEGITTDGTWVYVVGSQSRGQGASLARFKFDASSKKASSVESMTGLEPMLEGVIPVGATASGGEDGKKGKKKDEASGLNIEGLAWDPKGSRLLLGVRSPVVDGMALAVPLRLRDPAKPLSTDNVSVEEPLRIDLGGSGIRGIEHDAASGGFQIIAGHPTGARDFRLVRWSGAGTAVENVQPFAQGEKPEGVTRAMVGGKTVTVVVFDTSQYAVLP
jgi:hypothetical protein